MEDLCNIRIVGIDEKRPPRIRKEPYIDLFFKLSDQPSVEWCDDFNRLAKKLVPPAKIDTKKGLFIDAYVREMDLIPGYLEDIKKMIIGCNERHNEKIRLQALADASANASLGGEAGEQGKLNKIIAALQFDE